MRQARMHACVHMCEQLHLTSTGVWRMRQGSRMHANVCVHECTRAQQALQGLRMQLCMSIHFYTHVCADVCTHVSAHVCTQVYLHLHTHATHMSIHMHRRQRGLGCSCFRFRSRHSHGCKTARCVHACSHSCACRHLCMCAYLRTCVLPMHAWWCLHVHTCMRVYTSTPVQTCKTVCVCTRAAYSYMCVHTCTAACACVQALEDGLNSMLWEERRHAPPRTAPHRVARKHARTQVERWRFVLLLQPGRRAAIGDTATYARWHALGGDG